MFLQYALLDTHLVQYHLLILLSHQGVSPFTLFVIFHHRSRFREAALFSSHDARPEVCMQHPSGLRDLTAITRGRSASKRTNPGLNDSILSELIGADGRGSVANGVGSAIGYWN